MKNMAIIAFLIGSIVGISPAWATVDGTPVETRRTEDSEAPQPLVDESPVTEISAEGAETPEAVLDESSGKEVRTEEPQTLEPGNVSGNEIVRLLRERAAALKKDRSPKRGGGDIVGAIHSAQGSPMANRPTGGTEAN